MHPKDWANPGRVRVLIKQDGKPVGPGGIKNSMFKWRTEVRLCVGGALYTAAAIV